MDEVNRLVNEAICNQDANKLSELIKQLKSQVNYRFVVNSRFRIDFHPELIERVDPQEIRVNTVLKNELIECGYDEKEAKEMTVNVETYEQAAELFLRSRPNRDLFF